MTSCSLGGRQATKIARRSSRTESRVVSPVPGTEEHRCAAFTHNQKSGLRGVSVSTMPAATASIADVSRTDISKKDAGRERKKSGMADQIANHIVSNGVGCVWDDHFFGT